MAKLKLMTVVGTRPEIIKLSEIIKKADLYFEHVLVHTGQNYDYELNQIFFEELGLRAPDYYLNAAGENVGETMGNVITRSYELMSAVKPDALLVLGDTNSCLCVVSAKRLKIPVFHMEAGNRCKDENLPEEVIRRIVDVSSDINLCYSEDARRHILASGVKPEYTFVVGSPMAEVLKTHREKIAASDVLERLGLEQGRYFLLSAHREENIDNEENFLSLMQAVNLLAERYDMPVLYSCHPRARKMIEKRGFTFHKNVIAHKPFGFFDYNRLQENAFCVISDSGTIPEESAALGFPAVSVRTSTERPEAMECGVFTIGSISGDAVLQAVEFTIAAAENGEHATRVNAYADDNTAFKVVRIIQSYAAVVDRMIWRKTDKR
ncbi:MAG: UDP-N-acetylglucosamine 2-epimerase (non-hydrolyzing) [Clostridia bacterium]|nr:UDP-N-acetylglucosamine 2-epimerase (non-hydrolyzing) [Clostridia bacterium]